MNTLRGKVVIVYVLAFLTGINFAVFPALGTVFTDKNIFDLTSGQFGNLFIPQVIFIIASSLFAPFLVNRIGPKKVLIAGCVLMILSTGFLWSLQFFMGDQVILFPVLLFLVACIGFGFGLSVTTLNPVAASLFPKNEASAILVLQFLVGLGTSTSPLMMALAGKSENWTYVPGIVFLVLTVMFILFLFLRFDKTSFFTIPKNIKIPSRLWVFFIAIVIYGFIEGAFGGFGTIILKDMGLDNTNATLGLSLFWGGVAVSRLLVGVLATKINLSKFFLICPLLVGGFLFFLPGISAQPVILSFMFILGFFMGSIFPGSIGWGTIEFPSYAVIVSGLLMAADQTGTGIITQVLGNLPTDTFLILKILSFSTIVIFVLLISLSKNSKIKEAF